MNVKYKDRITRCVTYDVIVIGGGHSGVEAALAATRIQGIRVLLITCSLEDFGILSCNPSIGGIGKGHLVSEIVALNGVMGYLSDSACINFRLLNRTKGPAVWGYRMQVDEALYAHYSRQVIKSVDIMYDTVQQLKPISKSSISGGSISGGFHVYGVQNTYTARSVILTTGTFLKGIMYRGHVQEKGGRIGGVYVSALSQNLTELGFPLRRLKTGTPPRLKKESIDFHTLESIWPEIPRVFDPRDSVHNVQIPCAITRTNRKTCDIVEAHLSESASYGGYIDSTTGPRYCPSIEDKVVHFKGRDSHLIFLEPQGLHSSWIYPSGLSNGLPPKVQTEMIHSIKGLQRATIAMYGYAVAYDAIDAIELTHDLQSKRIHGLFFAGQINGTTGYEEAAAQGIIAGYNAAFFVKNVPPYYPSRADSYIGVMINDLVSTSLTEPYRVYTGRSEHRLWLRPDNACNRLIPSFLAHIAQNKCTLIPESNSIFEWWKQKEQTTRTMPPHTQIKAQLYTVIRNEQLINAHYAPYLHREKEELAFIRRQENIRLPLTYAYNTIPGLSNEAQDALKKYQPDTLGQAVKIPGITPSAALILARHFA